MPGPLARMLMAAMGTTRDVSGVVPGLMIALAFLLLTIAIVLGLHQGLIDSTPITRVTTAAVLLAVSNLLACWPYFVPEEPSSWVRTYGTGLLFTGWASLGIHVLPFV